VDYKIRNEGRIAWEHLNGFKKYLAQIFGKKWYIGDEKHEGWSGYLPFYIFWCPCCESPSKDYPHGYPERQYLLCTNPNCEARISFVLLRTKFKRAWSFFVFILRLAKLRNAAR
jgi:hypothetical protein